MNEWILITVDTKNTEIFVFHHMLFDVVWFYKFSVFSVPSVVKKIFLTPSSEGTACRDAVPCISGTPRHTRRALSGI